MTNAEIAKALAKKIATEKEAQVKKWLEEDKMAIIYRGWQFEFLTIIEECFADFGATIAEGDNRVSTLLDIDDLWLRMVEEYGNSFAEKERDEYVSSVRSASGFEAFICDLLDSLE